MKEPSNDTAHAGLSTVGVAFAIAAFVHLAPGCRDGSNEQVTGDVNIRIETTNHNTYLPGATVTKDKYIPVPIPIPVTYHSAKLAECPSAELPNLTDSSNALGPSGSHGKN